MSDALRGLDTDLTNLVNALASGMTKRNPSIVRETVGLYDAKTHLSSLVDRAAKGEEIVISKSGKPMARLVPMGDVHPRREPGKGRGQWKVSDDFEAPLPADILSTFGHPGG